MRTTNRRRKKTFTKEQKSFTLQVKQTKLLNEYFYNLLLEIDTNSKWLNFNNNFFIQTQENETKKKKNLKNKFQNKKN